MTVDVVVIVKFGKVTVDVVVASAGDAIQVPSKPTDAFLPGGLEYSLLISSMVKEPVADWPLGSDVSRVVGKMQAAVATPPAGKRFATKPPTVPPNEL
jgi:hypothetical protein